MGGHSCCHPPLCVGFCVGLSTSCSFLYMQLCSHSLFVSLLKGKQGKIPDHLLIILHFFFFNLWEVPTNQAKYCVIKRYERCAKTGDEQSLRVTGLKLVARQKETHAESSFLKRGFSCQKLLTNPYLSFHFCGIRDKDLSSVFLEWKMSTWVFADSCGCRFIQMDRTNCSYFDAHKNIDYYEQQC